VAVRSACWLTCKGPKIRIGKFKDGKITLAKVIALFWMPVATLGDQTRVGLDYKELIRDDVKRGATLLLDDGRIEMWVEEVKGTKITARWCRAACCPTTRASTARAVGFLPPR
jgi:pyruvate kinase